MPSGSTTKRRATELAKATGINYTAALRVIEYQDAHNPAPALIWDPTKLVGTFNDAMTVIFDIPAEMAKADPKKLFDTLEERHSAFEVSGMDTKRAQIKMARRRYLAVDRNEFLVPGNDLTPDSPVTPASPTDAGRGFILLNDAGHSHSYRTGEGHRLLVHKTVAVTDEMLALAPREMGEVMAKLFPGWRADRVKAERKEIGLALRGWDMDIDGLPVAKSFLVRVHQKFLIDSKEHVHGWLEEQFPGYRVLNDGVWPKGDFVMTRKASGPEWAPRVISYTGSTLFVAYSEADALLPPDALAALLEERHPGFGTDRIYYYRLSARLIRKTSLRARPDFDIEVKPAPVRQEHADYRDIRSWLEGKYDGFVVVASSFDKRYAMVRAGSPFQDPTFTFQSMDSFLVPATRKEFMTDIEGLASRLEAEHPALKMSRAWDYTRDEIQMTRRSRTHVINVTDITIALDPAEMADKMRKTNPGWKIVKVDREHRRLLMVPDPGAGPDTFERKIRSTRAEAEIVLLLEDNHPGYTVGEVLSGGRYLMVRKAKQG